MDPRAIVAALLALPLAGCLGGQPAGDDATDGGVGNIDFPVQPALLGLAGCRGVISRFLAPVEAMRSFVHPGFQFYEGTDAQEVPGAGTTAVSVSVYQCEGAGDAPPGPTPVAFIFARVKAPEGVDVAEPLSYVARFYAPLQTALFADSRGLSSIPANITVDTQGLLGLGAQWTVDLEAPDGTFSANAIVDPSTPADQGQAGEFLAITADNETVTWLVSNITVTARNARGSAESSGAFQAYTAGQPAPFAAAVVDPLEFPILMHRLPWDGTTVPPPPRATAARAS